MKKIWLVDTIVIFFSFFLFDVFNPFLVLIIGFLGIIPYLLLTDRKQYIKYFAISIMFGIVWSYLSRGLYTYSQGFPQIGQIDLYLLFAWSSGLFAYLILFKNIKKIQNYKFAIKFIIFTIIYYLFLLFVETVAYHVFGIHNELAKNYEPIKFCNCIHGPRWVQISYFIIGPLYFVVCTVLDKILKNKNS